MSGQIGPFRLVHIKARQNAQHAVQNAPNGYVVKIVPPTRSLEMNAKFHAMCGDFEKCGIEWAGKIRTAGEWKVLLVSAHAVATNHPAEVVPGLEGEFVNLRESTALMSKERGSSLIEYAQALGDQMGVTWSEEN